MALPLYTMRESGMNEKPKLLRETDEEARRQARTLLRSLRHAPLAVIDPENGFPSVSRVLVGFDIDGAPVILVSALSAHTKALRADPRASLLAGDPGKGDPLAHPRLSVQCIAEAVARDSKIHDRLRKRFMARHPKSKLYIDFPDFCFFRLVPNAASLNGGFGKAYVMPGYDLLIHSPANEAVAENEDAIVRELLECHSQLIDRIKQALHLDAMQEWRPCSLDAAGFALFSSENMVRFDFEQHLENYCGCNSYISKIEYSVREI